MGNCYNSTVVNAPIDTVWETVRDFHNMTWAQGMNLKVDAVGNLKGDQVGAVRIINELFHETLVEISDRHHSLTYQITDGPGAVARDAVKNYYGKMELHAITDENKTFVLWTSSYDSPDSGAVGELCNPIYSAALKGLKDHFG